MAKIDDAIADLDRRFGIPHVAQILAGNGGLAKVRIASDAAEGEMYLHGAHVTSWKPRGAEEMLFVSSHSLWENGKAIRGGVPICFPWFAGKADDPHAPAHGFVRTQAWELESITQSGAAVTVSMFTASTDATKRWWPADFRLVYRVTFGAELILELEVVNTGKTPLRFEEALHAYYRVGDVQKVRLSGLQGITYLDKTEGNKKKIQTGPIAITSETDRVYLNSTHAIGLDDPVLKRSIQVTKENSRTTVIWNPWVEKAGKMSDFGKDEWPGMVCVECSNVGENTVHLEPGQRHIMSSRSDFIANANSRHF